MQSPWVCYTNKIRELFKRDPDIHMTWSDETLELNMYVDNAKKADALRKILPAEKVFSEGKNVVKISILPANGEPFASVESTINDAFEGNPLFHFSKTIKGVFQYPITYVVFAKEIIQYFNDDLGDYYCNANCLVEDLARDVLENVSRVFFSTDIK